jgi:hypothetical protein
LGYFEIQQQRKSHSVHLQKLLLAGLTWTFLNDRLLIWLMVDCETACRPILAFACLASTVRVRLGTRDARTDGVGRQPTPSRIADVPPKNSMQLGARVEGGLHDYNPVKCGPNCRLTARFSDCPLASGRSPKSSLASCLRFR